MSSVSGVSKCLWCGRDFSSTETAPDLCADCKGVAGGSMPLAAEMLDALPFGALELDARGTVLAFNHPEEDFSGYARCDVIGRNFFKEIAPCADVQEFHGRFNDFLRGSELAERFHFTYGFPDKDVEVLITFLRVSRDKAVAVSRRMPAEVK